jgi:hypothetical protein
MRKAIGWTRNSVAKVWALSTSFFARFCRDIEMTRCLNASCGNCADSRSLRLVGPIWPLLLARNFRKLRHHGFTVRKTVDCWIATFRILQRLSLLHRDRDFHPFEKVLGLNVVHP